MLTRSAPYQDPRPSKAPRLMQAVAGTRQASPPNDGYMKKAARRRGPLEGESRIKATETDTVLDSDTIPVLISNAIGLNSVGAELVDDAVRALKYSLYILKLHDKRRFPWDPFATSLYKTFEGFERFLFKPTKGAGLAVCVAIIAFFIITKVLKRLSQHFDEPILIEAGVEPALQALFGLLSATYRNIGILNILQEFSGRELRRYSSGPELDIIEALDETFMNYDPRPTRIITASRRELGNRNRVSVPAASRSPMPMALSADETQANTEGFCKRDKPHDFFVAGRAFTQILTWQPGSLNEAFEVRSQTYTEYRRFVVIQDKPKENYSLSYINQYRPITTYGGRGVSKSGVDPSVHAVIHTSAHPPPLLEKEPPMSFGAVRVVAKSSEEKLAPVSRVNLGKTCSVEWNALVKEIGKVDKDRLPTLISDWKAVINA
ncbi:MAG: hypothetical protein Q9168_006374 [Polycauliona sp. 1 TL-2023]